jgi:hypothetical protein
VDLEPSSEIWFIGVKQMTHLFSYVRRDILDLSMVDPMFSGISSERKALVDVVPIHMFIQT